jgi:archaellum component FlaG (FlaF/FlaG flagellin family)
MVKRNLMIFVGVIILIFASVACEFSASTANIGDAWLSDSEDGNNRVTTFSQDAVFYAFADLKNAPEDTTLKAVWIAVDAEGVDPNFVINETEFTSGSNIITFNLSNNNLWPVGKYRVEIYLNGKLDKTLDFEVR